MRQARTTTPLPQRHQVDRHGFAATESPPIFRPYDGAEARRHVGLCVVGGLVFFQLTTPCITPVYYPYLDAFQRWMQGLSGRKPSLTLNGGQVVGNR
jgi:hypothetical protein